MKSHLISFVAVLIAGCASGDTLPVDNSDAGSVALLCSGENEACNSDADCCQQLLHGAICATTVGNSSGACMKLCIYDADCCPNPNEACYTSCQEVVGHSFGACT